MENFDDMKQSVEVGGGNISLSQSFAVPGKMLQYCSWGGGSGS